jgi:3-oxoacyl-[acyl-carrier protein] reductase
MDFGLRGKAVLVTGGSRGIGRAIALAFAEEGANVAICARNPEQLARTDAELRALGVKTVALAADLFHAADCRRVVDETAAAFGRLDVLVNNASTNVAPSLERSSTRLRGVEGLSDDQAMERVQGKTLAYLRCARAAIPHLRRAGGGRIICIGGGARFVGDGLLPNGLGNSGVAYLAKQLSHEGGRDQILVNVVSPGFTRTDRTPARLAARARERGISLEEAEASFAAEMATGRIVDAADIAPLVVFLASRQASSITGQNVTVDGGWTPIVNY